MDDIDREFEIDWAFHICNMDFVQMCIAMNIHQDELKPLYMAGWVAGNRRASAAAKAVLNRLNSTLETADA